MIDHQGYKISRVYTSLEDFNISHAVSNEISLMRCTIEEMKKLSVLQSPPKVIGLFEMTDEAVIQDPYSCQSAIYLDEVQDPGNVGAIIRIADWFGIECVARSEGSADLFNPKTVQASMGSLGKMNCFTVERSKFSSVFSNQKVISATSERVEPSVTSIGDAFCLIVSNEGHGLSNILRPSINQQIYIPGASNRAAESLNVAVATGIICSQLTG